MSKMPVEIKDKIESSLIKVDKEVNRRNSMCEMFPKQETNIFRILRVEGYEIRHGAFLEFLCDPIRNFQLSSIFVRSLIENIIRFSGIEDTVFSDIAAGENFSIDKISGEGKYREIKVDGPRKFSIDHALEVKVGKRRRAIVFEYKHNGFVYNDLSSYKSYVSDKYNGRYSDCYFFLVDLGDKSHAKHSIDGFLCIAKSVFIDAISFTYDISVRCDLNATSQYLKQYLEILSYRDDHIFQGLEKELWDIWNPRIEKYEDSETIWGELVGRIITDSDTYDALFGFSYVDLFYRAAEARLSKNGFKTRVISEGLRVLLPDNPYSNYYLLVFLHEDSDGLYVCINIASYQSKKEDCFNSRQQEKVFEVIGSSNICPKNFQDLDLNSIRRVWFLGGEVKDILPKAKGTKRVYDSSFIFMYKVSIDDLRGFCIDSDYSVNLEGFIMSLLNVANISNKG